jgi:transmembrane sensor
VVWPFRSAQDRLDDKAADWASKMLGPERERHREVFEHWYRSSPAHAEAFDEATAGFEGADVLRQGELGRARNLPERSTRTVPLRYAFGAVVAAAALALIFLVSAYMPSPLPTRESAVRYAAGGDALEVQLPDGSRLTLARGSVALVAFTLGERRVTLERGRGRFSVAHEARPFRVGAGSAEVIARGTVFEVSLTAGQASVALIEGSVDVFYPTASARERARLVRRLQPGEQIVIGGSANTAHATRSQLAAHTGAPPGAEPGPAMLQFDNTPLAAAVAEANRHSRMRIRLADPSIGELKITGAFRAGDAEALAESLVAAFNLHLERRPDGTLLLHSGPPPLRRF